MTQTETNMPNHIDYEGETRADKLAFSAQVTQQLQLRNINTEGRLNVQVQTLREVLFDQDEYFTISKTIDRYEKAREERLISIMWCVPCIMHLHNRVVEKIIVMLLKRDIASEEAEKRRNCIYVQLNIQCTYVYWVLNIMKCTGKCPSMKLKQT